MKQAFLHRIAAPALAALLLAACNGERDEGSDCPAHEKAQTPSGFCLPRYLTLKRDEVFGRKGPGKDYPAVYVYHALGLPVQVVDETSDWRRICDPDGATVWVSRSMVDGRRSVMALAGAPAPLYAAPKPGAAPTAYLKPRAVAVIVGRRGAWAQIRADGRTGWVKPDEVWGLNDALQCR